MRGNLHNTRFIFFFCLFVLTIILSGAEAWAQRSNTLATSALIVGGPAQRAECVVSNVSNNTITVDVQLVAIGSPTDFELIVEPNRTSSADVVLPHGTEFFCKFRTSGNNARIRAAARVLDLSDANLVAQKAEAR